MSKINTDCVYKVLLLGDSTVGKTCVLLKYTDKIFQDTHMMTIGLDYRLKTMKLQNGQDVKLQIWDTAGQDRFRSITKNYYKGSNGIILIYDVTSLKTFENVKSWVSQIHEEISDKVVIYLVGNKVDMEEERKVTTEEGQKLAEELGVPFIETSAKSGLNIDEIFNDIVERIHKAFGNIKKPTKNISYQAPDKKCCA
jgi:small GTP-binding protein